MSWSSTNIRVRPRAGSGFGADSSVQALTGQVPIPVRNTSAAADRITMSLPVTPGHRDRLTRLPHPRSDGGAVQGAVPGVSASVVSAGQTFLLQLRLDF